MKKFIILFVLTICWSVNFLYAQNKRVSGVVSDDKGPVEGASVIEKATPANGTTTDVNGKFTLALKGTGNTLVVSASGFLSQEINASSQPLTIKLAIDTKGLGEVIVIGYGKQKKITLTGSASSISGPSLRQNPSASLQNGLSGRLPGFSSQQRTGRPGGDGAAFFIRGSSSFTGANTPLIIVDDIEYSYDQFSALDPNEVESITILKDASTTAVYGIKGANGVVVVTTRRGKSGPPKISLRTEYATMEPTIFPKFLDAYNTTYLYDQAQINDNKYAATPNPAFVPKFSDQDLELYKNGSDPYGHPNVDWKKELFRDYSHQLRTNLDITGGTERVKYFVSLGYISQGGILNDFSKGQGFNGNYYNQRFNYRSNLDIKATEDLDLRIDLYGNRGEVNNPNIFYNTINGRTNDAFYEYSTFLSLAPFAYPVKNPDGSWGYSKWQRNDAGGGNYNGNNIIGRLSLDGYTRNNTDNMNFITSANQKLDFITRGLSVKGLVSYASNYNYNKDLTRLDFPSFIYNPAGASYEARDLNIYTNSKLGTNYNTRYTFRDFTLQGMLNYDRSFGNHHVYGLALANRNSKTTAAFTPAGATNPTYNFIPINFQGFTGRVGYDYKNKYLFQFNAGYNGTDRFESSKRFGFFPAVSAGYNLAEEKFFNRVAPFINQFKLRGSYGIVGSDAIGSAFSYAYRQEYILNPARIYQGNFGFSSNGFNSIQEGALPNTNVTWEKENKLDIGIDFGLFNNKLTGTVDYFYNNRYDILTTRGTVSQIFGQDLPPVNLGKTNNKGFEIELNYKDKVGKDFTYTLKATYSFAKNKVVFRDEPTFKYAYEQATGQSINQNLIYKWTGHFFTDQADIDKNPKTSVIAHPGDLQYADINGDGIINADDRGYFGYPNLPNTNYGFQFGFSYKRFSVNVLFQGAMNFTVNASTNAFFGNLTEIHKNAWTPQLGDNAQYPYLTLTTGASDPNNFASTFWFRSGNYLRLRTAEISYQLPAQLLSRIKINDIRFYINGNNIYTWSKLFKLYSLDPEVNPGTDRIVYPPQRIINIGLNITF
jgi:TonB-linked SusC/RagA family outer membrane protein